jgi:hypothetical protein
MTTAFVLGNGRSRMPVPLERLAAWGTIYGCNALYRDFMPSVLVSTDPPISTRIQEEGVSQRVRHYTRRPLPNCRSQRIPQDYFGFSSGPAAVGIACDNGHTVIYMVGFDLGALPNNRFNNVYADTEFYRKSASRPTFTGNWVKQICQITRKYPRHNFIRVVGENTAEIQEFTRLPNLAPLAMTTFLDRINTGKGL